MAEDPQPMTLQQRIASLNAAHIGRVPGEAPLPRPKPQIPQKRPVVVRQKSVNNPPEQVHGSVTDTRAGNQPAGGGRQTGFLPPPPLVRDIQPARSAKPPPPPLPKRQPSQPPPPLPARNVSQDASRRGSEDSSNSGSGSAGSDGSRLIATRTKSNESASRIKAPAWGESDLPALPPRGAAAAPRKFSSEVPKYVNRAPSCTSLKSLTSTQSNEERPPVPQLPPRPPSRNASSTRETKERRAVPVAESVAIPPLPSASTTDTVTRSALSFALNKPQPPPAPVSAAQNGVEPHASSYLLTVPRSSRPDLSALQATKPRLNTTASSHSPATLIPNSTYCLICRDFSGPDSHAAAFPRQSVNSLPALAEALTRPFPSHTDKARAIFTWLHYNVSYDVNSFFAGNIKPSTPNSTLSTGLAVCEGYAALFANLATHAGLEALVISGHGKGFGYTPLAPNSPLPPYNAGHAWNAVRIDDGEWKLIDPCWGAGHVQGRGLPYIQGFHPEQFTMTNREFGIKHFPGNKEHFFLPGGQRLSWEEYITINPAAWPDGDIEPATVFTNAKVDYGIGERTITPRSRKIRVNDGSVVRFSFGLLCPHWTLARHTKKGLPPVFMLATGGVDGRQKAQVPLDHVRGQGPDGGGDMWYLDIPAKELGAPGQGITLFAVTSFGDRVDARGLTVREFREGIGRVGMGFMGVAAWDLV